jgi:hypothetical protein
MSNEQINQHDPRIQSAVEELRGMIHDRFPQAVFSVSRGEDPEGIYLDAIVDVEDPDEVMDLVIDRLFQLRVDEGLPVHVLPQRPVERSLEALRSQHTQRPWAKPDHTQNALPL